MEVSAAAFFLVDFEDVGLGVGVAGIGLGDRARLLGFDLDSLLSRSASSLAFLSFLACFFETG